MRVCTASATGKIILSGEYAMLFGFPGVALPSREKMHVRFEPARRGGLTVIFGDDDFHPQWAMYAGHVAENLARQTQRDLHGELRITTDLPLGKGMGSSTALVVALTRALVGTVRDAAEEAENMHNPGHSGMDLAVIWEEKPIVFRRGRGAEVIELPEGLSDRISLIDAGMPQERTTELVSWMLKREDHVRPHCQTIGTCTERLLRGEPLANVLRDHHRAQVALGVVPKHAQTIIDELESRGMSGKVIGAGARTGGGGMVLVVR